MEGNSKGWTGCQSFYLKLISQWSLVRRGREGGAGTSWWPKSLSALSSRDWKINVSLSNKGATWRWVRHLVKIWDWSGEWQCYRRGPVGVWKALVLNLLTEAPHLCDGGKKSQHILPAMVVRIKMNSIKGILLVDSNWKGFRQQVLQKRCLGYYYITHITLISNIAGQEHQLLKYAWHHWESQPLKTVHQCKIADNCPAGTWSLRKRGGGGDLISHSTETINWKKEKTHLKRRY